jgi:Ca2+-binding EF-hand superfamily protein
MRGRDNCSQTKSRKLPNAFKTLKKRHPEENPMMNKTIFEEKWSVIRSQATARWSLMAEYDLNKVDKAEVKFDKFVTMLQVKYGYTRQKAREEITRLWAEYEAKSKIKNTADETGSS